jgi:hypothetical protein
MQLSYMINGSAGISPLTHEYFIHLLSLLLQHVSALRGHPLVWYIDLLSREVLIKSN